ncbi:MAG: hypothetical protein AABY22_35980 [Nanoarchaeota archaeon]
MKQSDKCSIYEKCCFDYCSYGGKHHMMVHDEFPRVKEDVVRCRFTYSGSHLMKKILLLRDKILTEYNKCQACGIINDL